jgi:F0F1-type ATP synthase assembly protein I
MQSDPDKERREAELQVSYGRYLGLGAQFAVVVGLFTWVGWWADRKLGTTPWFLLAGALLGFVGSFLAIVKAVPTASSRRSSAKPPESKLPPS